jgi:hypothetical protein
VFAQIQDGLRRSHYRFSSDAEVIKFLTERYFIEVRWRVPLVFF